MSKNNAATAVDAAAARRDFYSRIDPANLAPLWEQLHNLVTRTPASACQAVHWPYREVRGYLREAGDLITAEEAIRRVLILENPGMRGQAAATTSLYAGLQLILPGEIAPPHRHTQSALRLILEGEGAYTSVEGEKTPMKRGDFVITPSWTWHEHGNETDQPMVWLDGLDVPLVAMLDASFAENTGELKAPLPQKNPGDSRARYGSNLLPVDYVAPTPASPLFSYPYADTLAALRTLAAGETADACHGYKLRYANPVTGGYPMPTIGAFIQLLPDGFATAPYRCSAGTVYAVIDGAVKVTLDGKEFVAQPNDVFVIPSWAGHRFEAQGETTLFSFSDRPVQEMLGLWREQR
ncbi:gentisate 1,2-dioxygenase [Herbaspirillum sp. RV1423]|uniref:gentisate 1,2-dioxygenase n=1 Tax=Herbaspirillum sp. RV1423 TaxID=1443993 RepID=UPI0004AFC738|nr:gentisate 1,2-dioxygenase [Herbaspirillum sp. RV1423]